MTILQAIVLGLIQGLTEFLPISSSGHLAITENLLGLKVAPAFDVLLHFASVAAILIMLWPDVWSVFTSRRRLILPLIVASIPAGVAGLFFKDYFESAKDLTLVGIGLMVTGIILALSDRFGRKERDVSSLSLLDAGVIGVAQAVALPPGISRSGMTISGGLFRGLGREECVRFSFLMAIPVIGGAALLELPKLVKTAESSQAAVLGLGFLASLVSSAAAIKLLLNLVRRVSLRVFSFYVVPLGMLLFLVGAPPVFARWLKDGLHCSAGAADLIGYALIAAILLAVIKVVFFGLLKRQTSGTPAD